jgi:hypothetical protein
MFDSFLQILLEDETMTIQSGDEFDGLRTFQSIQQMMPPIGTYDRIILDFSGISGITPSEIYRMSNEMLYDPHFRNVEISMVGFRLDPAEEIDAVNDRDGMPLAN